MEFVESPLFTKLVHDYITDREYSILQQHLLQHPESGVLIPKSNGLRKIRMAAKGHGKSGGVRTIYFWKKAADQIFMLLIYSKSKKDTLTDTETEILRGYVKEL